ncbi:MULTISPECIES: hypothetical protein [Prochlorococcus]|uniref:hypothetical protein n=1 Tax=Prochlorococcus TaxID=1218 RepID=UPI00053391DB|nr:MULTISPECIES: hypothetical protein [Prochlorococcus]KGG12161.1 hypothetical protein EV05_1366 [Prochlorococcus sp. MIT 0601]
MNDEKNNFAKEIKPVIKEVKDSLPFIKTIFLAPLALGFALGERYLQEITKRQQEAKKQAEISALKKLAEERERRIEERKAQEDSKIAEEKRAEERAIRARLEERKITPKKIIHTGLYFVGTLALISGVLTLIPIAKRAKYINECVEDKTLTSLNEMTISQRVILCSKGE